MSGYLICLACCDIREKKVPIWMLLAGSVCGVLTRLISVWVLHEQWQWEFFTMGLAVLPGIFLLLTAKFTHKAGMGDGWTLVNIGLFETYKSCVFAMGVSLVIMAIVSGGLLVLHRVQKQTRMPYLPFLATAYLCQFLF